MRTLAAFNADDPSLIAAPEAPAEHTATASARNPALPERLERAVPCIPPAALPAERPERVPATASALEWVDAPATVSVPEQVGSCRLPAKRLARSVQAPTRAAAASNIQRARKAP